MAPSDELEALRQAVVAKQEEVTTQGDTVRALKAAKADRAEIDAAIEKLKHLKIDLESATKTFTAKSEAEGGGKGKDASINREAFRQAVNNALERRLFIIPSFKIYGGVAGLFDYGPPGCAVKSNVLAFWRQVGSEAGHVAKFADLMVKDHFVLEENMLEVDCPCVTPDAVLRASGHVDKFTDLMVRDVKTQACYRADHLLKDHLGELLEKEVTMAPERREEIKHVLAVLDEYGAEELDGKLKEFGVKAPDTKNDLSAPYPFNLMFSTAIGPTGLLHGYLWPKTAQGIFVTFKDLLYYIGGKLPFAAPPLSPSSPPPLPHSPHLPAPHSPTLHRSHQLPPYLRPETAQGIFVNFKDLLYYNGGKLPFAAAQIGQAFRNEPHERDVSPMNVIPMNVIPMNVIAGLLRVREVTLAEIERFVSPTDKSLPYRTPSPSLHHSSPTPLLPQIAPRATGLLRVREFTLAEIEHFVSPADKSHPRFSSVADLSFLLYPRAEQLGPKQPVTMRLGDAVEKGIINNATLGYFIGRTFLFLSRLGIDPQRLRFRQHLQHEMAHYATDCWDAEIECSYGWVECVENFVSPPPAHSHQLEKSKVELVAYEKFPEPREVEVKYVIKSPLPILTFLLPPAIDAREQEKSKVELVAYEKFPEPREVEVMSIVPSKKDIGKAFKRDAKLIAESLEAMTEAEALAMKAALEADGKVEYTPCGGSQAFSLSKEMVAISKEKKKLQAFSLSKEMVAISKEKKKLQGQSFTPSVIEPSFGIGRIIYCIYEHSFYSRPSADEARTVFRFTPLVAPIKCTVFPLVQRGDLEKVAQEASAGLTKGGVANKIDTTGTTIGKRYARTDELGCPFAITVDGQTLEDGTVTLRERDSTAQVRIHKDEVASVVRQLADGLLVWTDVQSKRFPGSDELSAQGAAPDGSCAVVAARGNAALCRCCHVIDWSTAQSNAVAANKGCAVDVVEQRVSSNPPEPTAPRKDGGVRRTESTEIDNGSQTMKDYLLSGAACSREGLASARSASAPPSPPPEGVPVLGRPSASPPAPAAPPPLPELPRLPPSPAALPTPAAPIWPASPPRYLPFHAARTRQLGSPSTDVAKGTVARDCGEHASSGRQQGIGTVGHTATRAGIGNGVTDVRDGTINTKNGRMDKGNGGTDLMDGSSMGVDNDMEKGGMGSKVERRVGRKRKAEREEEQAAGRAGLPHSVSVLDSKFGLLAAVVPMLDCKFGLLAAVYGFLEQWAVKATWKRLEVALKALGSSAEGEAVALQDIRDMAALAPSVIWTWEEEDEEEDEEGKVGGKVEPVEAGRGSDGEEVSEGSEGCSSHAREKGAGSCRDERDRGGRGRQGGKREEGGVDEGREDQGRRWGKAPVTGGEKGRGDGGALVVVVGMWDPSRPPEQQIKRGGMLLQVPIVPNLCGFY
ncbi:unnamed protein product [Closterium sp. NIES-65]|nr:unnamed protein product [Closterium sp. NIES-65]